MNPELLVGGAVNGAILAALALAVPRLTRPILFSVLVFAAAMYVVFWIPDASPEWLALELAGVALYGAIGYRGLKGSAWWLVAGWLAHPLWDIALHYTGPGHVFAPVSYTVPCLTYDLAVAAMLALRIAVSGEWSRGQMPRAGVQEGWGL